MFRQKFPASHESIHLLDTSPQAPTLFWKVFPHLFFRKADIERHDVQITFTAVLNAKDSYLGIPLQINRNIHHIPEMLQIFIVNIFCLHNFCGNLPVYYYLLYDARMTKDYCGAQFFVFFCSVSNLP